MTEDFSRYRVVISYSRFSTPEQSQGASTARQSDAAAAFATRHHLTLSPRSCLDAGLSGYHGDHLLSGAFGALLDSLRDGTIATPALVLVEAADRFGRLPSIDALRVLFDRLFEAGADLYLLDRNLLVTADRFNRDLGTQITLLAEIHAAHAYSARLSQRLLDAHQRGREAIVRGEAVRKGWAPAWVRWDDTTTTWQLTDYAAAIDQLLTLLESGLGQLRTAAALNAANIPTPRGKCWTPGSIAHLAYSPAVAGGRETRRRTGEIAWDYYPAVWPRPRWEALKQQMQQRDGADGGHGKQGQMLWVGQGITKCLCGAVIGARTASCVVKGERITHQYLRCRARLTNACDQPAIRLQLATAHLLTRLQSDTLAALFARPDKSDAIAQLRQQAAASQQRIIEARAMLAVLETELSKAAASEPALVSVLARQVVKAEAEIEQLDTTHQQLLHQVAQYTINTQADHCAETAAAASRLLQAFARGEDTTEQRHGVNAQLRKAGVTIHLDSAGERMGLVVGDGAVQWMPVSRLAHVALAVGAIEAVYADSEVQTLAQLRDALEQAAGTKLDKVQVEVTPGQWVELP